MAKNPRSTEAKIDRLDHLVNDPAQDAVAGLRKALQDKSAFVAAHAARLAQDKLLYELIEDMVAAYRRFLIEPLKHDKTCAAKRALIRALYELDFDDIAFFRQAVRYIQLEPVWGGHVDTAVEVRCHAALALAAYDPDAVFSLLALLYDEQPPTRSGAVKAVALLPQREALIALRQKVLQDGNEEVEIIADCLLALLKLNPEQNMDLVERFCRQPSSDMCQAALLALGESRSPGAWEFLKTMAARIPERDPMFRALLKAMALLRDAQSFDYLLELIDDEHVMSAVAVIEVLSIYNYHDKLLDRLQRAVGRCANKAIAEAFERYWTDITER